MASCVRNICAKNRCNPLILFKVTIDNTGVPFFETQCTVIMFNNHIDVNIIGRQPVSHYAAPVIGETKTNAIYQGLKIGLKNLPFLVLIRKLCYRRENRAMLL